MSSSLPASLTVLRPIGFGTIRGPDGTDVSVMPNHSQDVTIDVDVTDGDTRSTRNTLHLPQTPQTPNMRTLSPKVPKPPRVLSPVTPKAASFQPSPTPSQPSPALSPSGVDSLGCDGDTIELGVYNEEGASSEEDVETFASAAELAHHAMAVRSTSSGLASFDRRMSRQDISRQEMERQQQILSRQRTVSNASNEEKHCTPESLTRTILLNVDAQPTVPQMPGFKTRTFAELKDQLRWSLRGLIALNVCIFIMGIANMAVGAVSLPTTFLSSFPYSTLVGGVAMAAFAPAGAWLSRQFKSRELRISWMLSGALFAYMFVVGIMVSTLAKTGVDGTVHANWVTGDRTTQDTTGKYSAARQAEWDNDAQSLIDFANSHLLAMGVVTLLSAAFLLGHMLLAARVTQIIRRHLHLASIQTRSKSETTTKSAKRALEIEEYKARIRADPGSDLALAIEEERIPDSVKRKLKAAGRKYEHAHAGEEKDKKRKKHAKDKDKGDAQRKASLDERAERREKRKARKASASAASASAQTSPDMHLRVIGGSEHSSQPSPPTRHRALSSSHTAQTPQASQPNTPAVHDSESDETREDSKV